MANYKEDDDTVSYESVAFFEKLLSGHSHVNGFTKLGHREYDVKRDYGDTIRVWLTGKYLFSETDYYELRRSNGNINCIIPSSLWNRYTPGAKERALQDEVGLFSMGEFAGALNWTQFWKYVKKKRY